MNIFVHLLVDVGLKFERAEMQMIRWMCSSSLKDRRTNEELRRLVGVEPIITFIRSGRLRWYGHVMRKGDEDWVKKCMEYRVKGRRPIGRPRKTWLESVEADMAELEIDKEDVHNRSKWRRNVNAPNGYSLLVVGVPQLLLLLFATARSVVKSVKVPVVEVV